MLWPSTADGDVFRRLESSGFDFATPHEIDFNVDFDNWPPAQKAVQWLEREYGEVIKHPPLDGSAGYVLIKVIGTLTYALVITTQDRVSRAMAEYHGACDSWGVAQSPSP